MKYKGAYETEEGRKTGFMHSKNKRQAEQIFGVHLPMHICKQQQPALPQEQLNTFVATLAADDAVEGAAVPSPVL